MSNKVLIITKDVKSPGGISSYFHLFFKNGNESQLEIQRAIIGSRAKDYCKRRNRKFAYFREYIQDLLRICKLLHKDPQIRIVHLNPSLIPVPLIRDGVILCIAKLFKRKVVVQFHGWNENVAQKIEKKVFLRSLFCRVYSRADQIVVLAKDFVEPLLKWGMDRNVITVSKTMFNGQLAKQCLRNKTHITKFLFLSRIGEGKGVFEIVEAAAILRSRGLKFHISFCGHGANTHIVDDLKSRARDGGVLEMFDFNDYVEGKEKSTAYSLADVFLLPSYNEGCPISVLEAMAAGLFVISTDVGALKEVINDGINGRFVKVRDPEDLASKMEWSIKNIAKVRQLGEKNRAYAFENFESTKIIGQIKTTYNALLTV